MRKVGFTGSVGARQADHGDVRRQPDARPARARRQRPRARARGRGDRRGGDRQAVRRRLPDHRPGVHGDEAALRAPLPLRRGRRGALGRGRRPEDRPGPARRRDDGAAATARASATTCSGLLDEVRARRRGARAGRARRRGRVRARAVHAAVARPRSAPGRPRRDRGAVRPDAADHPVRRRGVRDRRGQRHLVGPVLVGVVGGRRARRPRRRPAADGLHVRQRPQRRRSSTSARRSAASTRAAWAARWARRGSSASPTRTRWGSPPRAPPGARARTRRARA